MKIILDNELEKYAWEIMMAAHYKWEKNHGDSLREQMDWYFDDLCRKETDKLVNEEVERRLCDEFGEEFFVSEDDYVKLGLEKYADDDLTDEEKQELEQDFREDYKLVREQIDDDRKYLPTEIRTELRAFYYTFFTAPENLTVIYNGKVIQGENK